MRTNRIRNIPTEHANEGIGTLPRLGFTIPAKRKNGPSSCEVNSPTRRRVPVTEAPATTIEVKIDVGFGNTVFIRGEGDGLSWAKGEPLICVDGSTWHWSRQPGREPVRFKLLLNDERWAHGEDLQVAAGSTLAVEPSF